MIIEDANLANNEIRIVVSPTQTKGLTETTGPATQPVIRAFGIASVSPHHFNPGKRL